MTRQTRAFAIASPLLALGCADPVVPLVRKESAMKRACSFIALPLLLVLAGCAIAPAPAPVDPGGGACNAAGAQFVVGRNADAATQEAARLRSGARIVRTLRPGQVVTLEYSGERLNLELDANGRVTRVRCG